MKGFMDFIRKQGVVGLAVGFILGGAVSKIVTAIVEDIVNPIISGFMGSTAGLKNATLALGPAVIKWGDFISVLVDFIIVAAVVYFGVEWLGLSRLDKKNEEKK